VVVDEKPRSPAEKERVDALAKVPMGNRGVMIQAMDDLKEFAETAVRSGTAPKKMEVGQAMMAIQAGLERGLGPLGGLQACVVINGVLSWRGWAAKGFIQQSGLVVPGTFHSGCEGSIENRRESVAVGFATAKRKGYDAPFRREFSVADAKRAGLWGKDGPWQTAAAAMLEWRAIGALARFEFPEILGGIPIAEEVAGGYGPPEVTVEDPQERAHRPAPKVTDPLLGQIEAGDQTGVEEPGEPEVIEGKVVKAGETDEDRQKALEEAAEVERQEEAPEKPKEEKKIDPCPRCGEADGGFAMFGECGVCGYPGPEPGEAKA
jgi:hypothetical protein